VLGALLSAFSPNFTWLLVARFILGLGIGGDYPASSVIMTEYANRFNRGRLVGLSFAFYVVGQMTAYLVSLLILGAGIPSGLAWRLILGFGAIPSLVVLWNRRHMPESPRWTLRVAGDRARAADDLSTFTGSGIGAVSPGAGKRLPFSALVRNRAFLVTLVGTGMSWLFYDIASYGNSVSQPLLIKSISPATDNVTNVAINALLVVCFGVTGALVGLAVIDRMRRTSLQNLGLGLCAVSMLLITLIPGLTGTVAPFAVIFGLSLFGSAFGPNPGLILLSAECYPTAARSTGHGISSSLGKVGAFVGAFLAPLVLSAYGLRITTLIAGVCFVLAILATLVLRDPAGVPLEAASAEMVDGDLPAPALKPARV
jgi:MFS transporter, PHS family, inorganic phosphate transporter